MGTRPHESYVYKDDSITTDFRVFWKHGTDLQIVLDEVFHSYVDIITKLQMRANGHRTDNH